MSSPLGALTEGTPHRSGKGADPEIRTQAEGEASGCP
jgi:hypothetical protein